MEQIPSDGQNRSLLDPKLHFNSLGKGHSPQD